MARRRRPKSRVLPSNCNTIAKVQQWIHKLPSPNAKDLDVHTELLEKENIKDPKKTPSPPNAKDLDAHTELLEKENIKDPKKTPSPPTRRTRYNLRRRSQRQQYKPDTRVQSPQPPPPPQRKNNAVTEEMHPPRSKRARADSSVAGSQSTRSITPASEVASTTTARLTNLSNIQKLMKLVDQKPPFSYDKPTQQFPQNLQQLYERLHNAAFQPKRIIPSVLRDQITQEFPLEKPPADIWDTLSGTLEEISKAAKLYTQVKQLYQAMRIRNGVRADIQEVAWYHDIQNALGIFNLPEGTEDLVDLVDSERSEDLLNFRNLTTIMCTSSNVITEGLPYDPATAERMKSAKVDLIIGYERMDEPLSSFLTNQAGKEQKDIPLTPLQGLEKGFLGAIPIEVKSARAGDATEARYQLTICASAMLRLRQLRKNIQQKEYDWKQPPIVVSLSVVGHVWSYYLMYLDQPPDPQRDTECPPGIDFQDYHKIDSVPRIMLGPFVAGHTTGILATFQLFHFLTVLKEWVIKEWAPTVFQELRGISATAQDRTSPQPSVGGPSI